MNLKSLIREEVRRALRENASVNEGSYYVGYNKGRGQGKGVYKDSYSSYKEAKKAVEKIEKMHSGTGNMTAYYVSDKDGNFVTEQKVRRALQEAAKPYFDTTNYRTSHGREPKPNQSGRWAFDIAGETHVTPKSMTYKDAQQWATAIAAKSNVQKIRTLA